MILRIVMALEDVPGHDEPLTTRRGISFASPAGFEDWMRIGYPGVERTLSGVEAMAVTEVLGGIRAMDHVLEKEGVEWPNGPKRR